MVQFEPIARFIQQIGFPIFVAVMLLFREDKRHSENIAAVNNLANTLRDLHACIERRFGEYDRARHRAKLTSKRK